MTRLYRLLLLAYPASLRRAHGSEMTAVVEQAWRSARARGLAARVSFIRKLLWDFLASLPRAWRSQPARRATGARRSGSGGVARSIRHGVRVLLARPIASATMVLTFTIAIGGTAAVFSVLYAVYVKPVPFKDANRLVVLAETIDGRTRSLSYPNYLDFKAASQSVESLAVYAGGSLNLVGDGDPTRVVVGFTSANLAETLAIVPEVGRPFAETDDAPGAEPVAIVAHEFWESHLGSRPDVLGYVLVLDGVRCPIVGVLPKAMAFPDRWTSVWIPLSLYLEGDRTDRGQHPSLTGIGRLRPGVAPNAARAELAGVAARLAQAYPATNARSGIRLERLIDQRVGDVRPTVIALVAAAVTVLLIATVNVSHLLLVTGAAREREFAVRVALGASRVALVSQLLVETALVAALGGVGALVLAGLALPSLLAIAPDSVLALDVHMNPTIVWWTGAVTLCAALLAGLLPALRTTRPDLVPALKGSLQAPRGRRASRALVSVEVALSLTLLISAGLLIRTLWSLHQVQPGFRTSGVVTMTVNLPAARYDAPAKVRLFYDALDERLLALPGIVRVGRVLPLPLGGSGFQTQIIGEDSELTRTDSFRSDWARVGGDYFRVMGIPVTLGRPFDARDGAAGAPVLMLDTQLATLLWPGLSPLGRRVRLSGGQEPWRTVVGVVSEVRHHGIAEPARPQFYLPAAQRSANRMSIVLETDRDGASLAPELRRAVSSIDAQQPVASIQAMADLANQSVSRQRFGSWLLGLLAAIALGLASIGLYGVLAQTVAGATREIGIRMAIGAAPGDVARLVAGEAIRMVGPGLAAGLILAVLAGRSLSGLLYGVNTADVLTFVGVTGTLLAAALAACVNPALRAMRIDPVRALRADP